MIGSFLERPFLIRMVFFFSFTVTVPLLALVCVSETDGSDGADEEEGDVEAEPDGAADDEAAGAGDTAGGRDIAGACDAAGSWEETADHRRGERGEAPGPAEPV